MADTTFIDPFSPFLDQNGREVVAPEADAVLVFLDLAAGKLSENELARWLEAHSRALKKRPGK